jgi:hypothetical protein
MIQDSQCVPLRIEAGQYLARLQPDLSNFYRHPSFDRLTVLGHEDDAHSPFANQLQKLVGADQRPDALAESGLQGSRGGRGGRIQNEAFLTLVLLEQSLDSAAQLGIPRALGVEKGGALRRTLLLKSLNEKISLSHDCSFPASRDPQNLFKSMLLLVNRSVVSLKPKALKD